MIRKRKKYLNILKLKYLWSSDNMTIDVNFNNIRIIDGKKDKGFEEFCCQVFHIKEKDLKVHENSRFYRIKGDGGDGGIEAYWQFPNDEEIGIQAKYFLNLDNPAKKWQQVKISIERVKISHPNLTKLIICFPIDLTDSGDEKKKSNRDRFNEIKKSWAEQHKNPGFELEFWGYHELTTFLQENTNLIPFWFHKTMFGQDLINMNFEQYKSIIGDRYQPDIHIKLANFDYFDYLAQNNQFIEIFKKKQNKLESEYYRISEICRHLNSDLSKQIKDCVADLFELSGVIIKKLIDDQLKELDYNDLKKLIKQFNNIGEQIRENQDLIINLDDKSYGFYNFKQDFDNLNETVNEFNDAKFEINREKIIFLNGEGGIGKTHLLASIVDKRCQSNLISLIFDGGQLDIENSTITDTIKKNCGDPKCNNDEFYSALDTLAFISGQRGLILVDSLDEQKNCKSWKKKIPPFLQEIKKYKNLALALSYRAEYEKDIINQVLMTKESLFCKAPGFKNLKISDLAIIFNKYNIEIPTLPSLYPEFYNPLFLISYCKFLHNSNRRQISSLIESYTTIFDNYVESLNEKISDALDLDSSSKIIQKVFTQFTVKMLEQEDDKLLINDAKDITKQYDTSSCYSKTILKRLLSDGFIHKFKSYDNEEYIRFTFSKYNDFAMVQYLLDTHLDIKNPLISFNKGAILYNHIFKYMRHGVVDMFAILLPEYTNGEFEIVDIFKKDEENNYNLFQEYFLDSLKNRKPQFITKRSLKLIFKYFMKQKEYEKIIDILLFLTLKDNSPIKAEKLHMHLKSKSLFKRDSKWTANLEYLYIQKDNIIEKILTYTWSCDDNLCNNKLAINYAIILCWFLVSSNRELRDRATKSLTNLFSHNLNIIPELIDKFIDINDPYVIERITCASYGALLRNKENKVRYNDMKNIALSICKSFFNNPQPHILIRDYIKSIIALVLSRIKINEIDLEKINKSNITKFPTIPSKKTIKQIYDCEEDMYYSKAQPLLKQAYSSVMAGDWGIYVLRPHIGNIADDKLYVNLLKKSERWILKRVADLCGYKTLSYKFKDYVEYNGRNQKTNERFGKKYQWIAFYEFIGYAYDKYQYTKSYSTNEKVEYDSPIHIDIRDIDPSLSNKEFTDKLNNPHRLFKDIISPNSSHNILREWCCNRNIIEPATLLQQQKGNVDYLNLCTDYTFYRKHSDLKKDSGNGNFIEFFYLINSYIIKKNDLKNVLNFLKDKTFFGRWMPQISDYGEMFHLEFCDCKYFQKYCKNDENWSKTDKFPFDFKMTTAQYYDDDARDHSYNIGAVNFLIPAPPLIKEMNLKHGGKDCCYKNDKDELTIINPYIVDSGDNSLLVNKNSFIEFLDINNYTIFWTIASEKRTSIGTVYIDGVYYLDNSEIKGSLKFSNFEKFPSRF